MGKGIQKDGNVGIDEDARDVCTIYAFLIDITVYQLLAHILGELIKVCDFRVNCR
jgi:hypothetical protein